MNASAHASADFSEVQSTNSVSQGLKLTEAFETVGHKVAILIDELKNRAESL